MNYRRGLQRVYLVLAVAWVAGVFIISLRDRPQRNWFEENAPKPPAALPADFKDWDKEPPKPLDLSEIETIGPSTSEIWRYWGVRSSVATLPPLVGYFFLFGVVPWVYRGFRA